MELEKENENSEKGYPPSFTFGKTKRPQEPIGFKWSQTPPSSLKNRNYHTAKRGVKELLSTIPTVKLVLGSHKWRNDSHEPHQKIQITRMNPTKINCFAIILSRNWLNSGAKPLIFFAKPCKSNLAPKAGKGTPNNFVMSKNNGFNYFLWAW